MFVLKYFLEQISFHQHTISYTNSVP